jgi:fructose-bisphosphate aldolase class I
MNAKSTAPQFHPAVIIQRKRDGEILTDAEIRFLINGLIDGSVADYQLSAFLMAVFFRGMTPEETVSLTRAMLESGERYDFSDIPGIKVDEGLVDLPGFPGEKITKGLDGLPERMIKYRDAGAKFAKWRAVITIGAETPTNEAIAANVFVLARYARICQDADIVPIVEPEVLFDGTHTAEQCEAVTVRVYDALISALRAYRVHLPGTILKTGMVLPGKDSGTPVVPKDVAERTVRVLHEHIPAELGGVVFLSGGQTSDQAFQNLNAIEQKGPHPWGVTFSYSRALQDPVLRYWAQHQDDPAGTQKLFASQLAVAVAARSGVLEMPASGGDFVSQSQDL